MAGATTPKPNKKEETPEAGGATPSEGGEAITPGEPEQEPQTPPDDKTKVAELESEVDTLKTQLKNATNLQRQADKKRRIEMIERKKLEIKLKKIQQGEDYVPPEEPEGETQVERETRLQAKIGIQNLILDNPEYQELIKQDITLKQVLRNNPFALIGEYFDAQDAVEQIKEQLDKRVSSLKKEKENQPEGDTGEGKGGKEFEVGPTQPGEGEPEAPAKEPSSTSPMDKVEESIQKKIKVT